MRQYLLKVAALLVLCFAMMSCEKQNIEEEAVVTNQSITVYGTVLNKVTHNPVIGVEVEIGKKKYDGASFNYDPRYCLRLSSSVSGTDGQFELQFVKEDDIYYPEFYLHVSCENYKVYYSVCSFVAGGTYRLDINLVPE